MISQRKKANSFHAVVQGILQPDNVDLSPFSSPLKSSSVLCFHILLLQRSSNTGREENSSAR